MKTKTSIIAILLAAGLINSHAQDTWTQKADFGGGPRAYAVGFTINNKGYVGTGSDNIVVGGYKKDFWEYDPATNTWTQKADFGGTARSAATGFSIGGKGYLGTGSDTPNLFKKDFWEYDPATNTWTRKADFGGASRYLAVGFSIGTKGYIGTGANGGCCPFNILEDVWEYDPTTDAWTQKADFGGGLRGHAASFTIEDKGYVGTGLDNNDILYKDFWEFDPVANTWTQKADFGGTVREDATGFSIGSKGYIGTGFATDGIKKDFWEYDPTVNAWTQKADFGGSARSIATGFGIGGKGYIGTGGVDVNELLKDFWEYTPATAQTSWIELAPTGGPPEAREIHVAVYDPATNRMTIHGGGNGSNVLNDAWVLTNADGTEGTSPTWTQLFPANPLARYAHSAVYDSFSNRMIVFGGIVVNGGQVFNDVWVLTNANGTGGDPEWLQLAPSGGPPAPRQNHTAVYDSASNRMTIFGGYSGSVCFGDVWVLTNANGMEPTTPSWIQLFPSGTAISARNGHTAVYDANSNRMIVFGGGCGDTSTSNDVWVLTNANGLGGDSEWIELAPDGTPPSPRYTPVAVYDPTTNRMVAFGGTNFSVTFNDTWVLTNANGVQGDTPAWLPLAPSGTLPASRSQFAATYSVSTNRLSIFAGDNDPNCCNLLNDVWVLPDANGIAAVVSLSQTALAFKTQLVGTTSKPQSITLTNTGAATLTISSIAASGDFLAKNNCGSSVPAGASCTINVAFNPSAKGFRTGSVTITDDAADSPQTIKLTGIGTIVQLAPSALNFGNQIVGTTSDPQTATITNIGSEDLHISEIGLGGANPGDFAETSTCGSKLVGGGSCTVDVTFTPTVKGHRHAKLLITDDGGGSLQSVPLKGTGVLH